MYLQGPSRMVDIYYQNVRGLKTKKSELLKNISKCNYSILAFTETWLNADVQDNEIIDSRYKVYRRDRQLSHTAKKDGGGILLAVSKDIESIRISLWDNDQETLWIVLKGHERKTKIALCIVYLPPPMRLKSLKSFLDSVEIVLREGMEVIVMGDFNLGPTMSNGTIPKRFSGIHSSITNFIATNNMLQVNWVKIEQWICAK